MIEGIQLCTDYFIVLNHNDSVKNDLKDFCLEGLVLNNRVSKMLDKKKVIHLVNVKKQTLKENTSKEDKGNEPD